MLGLLLAAAGLGGIGLCLHVGAERLAFLARSSRASAVVERVEVRSTKGRGSEYVPWFRYVDGNGYTVLARSRNVNGWPRYAATQAVQVRYAPADPAWAEADWLPTLLFGPLLLLVFSALILSFACVFLRTHGLNSTDTRLRRVRTVRCAWGTVTTHRGGVLPSAPRPLKLLIAGLGYALASLVALAFLHGELTASLARFDVSAEVVGQLVPRVTERQLIRGEWVPVYAPAVRFTSSEGRVLTLDARSFSELRGVPLGDPVRMRYLRADPATAAPAGLWRDWHSVLAAGAASLAVLGVGGTLLRHIERRTRRA